MYRTGDLVVEDETGTYQYIARIDNMVKSRGYRIELGEIESVLYQHAGIREAVVVAIPDEEVTSRLKAYVVCDGQQLDTDAVLKHCRERIPRYMVPEFVEFLDALPQTSTGKVDRKALSRP